MRRAGPLCTSIVLSDSQAEKFCEALASRRGQLQSSGIALAFEPPEFQTATTNFCPDVARQVISSFAPIEAGPAKDAAATKRRCQIRAKSGQHFSATIGDFTSIVVQNYAPVRSQWIVHWMNRRSADPRKLKALRGNRGNATNTSRFGYCTRFEATHLPNALEFG